MNGANMTEQTTHSTDQAENESTRAPNLLSRLRAHGSTLVMGGLIVVSGAGLYAMHLHTRPSAATIITPASEDAIGPQTIIAFQHTIEETRKLVDAVQTPSDVINASLFQISDPFTYVLQHPPERAADSPTAAPARSDHDALRNEVLRLNLQSILRGRTNYCLVNNQLFTWISITQQIFSAEANRN
ncbi:MAG TPA: hypothetical protein PK402_04720, partial [Tepidisphaeraceae bacterium]|nr:hypothetical protein [Tepidisphaeraceae bacterium]